MSVSVTELSRCPESLGYPGELRLILRAGVPLCGLVTFPATESWLGMGQDIVVVKYLDPGGRLLGCIQRCHLLLGDLGKWHNVLSFFWGGLSAWQALRTVVHMLLSQQLVT